MARNLFTILFGASLLVAILMITNAQPNVAASVQPVSVQLPFGRPSLLIKRPGIPIWRPRPPIRRPTPPTWRPRPPTRRPTPPTRRPRPPTKIPTRRPSLPTRPPTWTVTLTITRKPRSAKRPILLPCSKASKCITAGPSLCVRSRNKKLCRRVANRCSLRKLNCQASPRNNWIITQQKCCCKMKVGRKAKKCKD